MEAKCIGELHDINTVREGYIHRTRRILSSFTKEVNVVHEGHIYRSCRKWNSAIAKR
ncbi:hypothetical protein [Bacteroides cellulosilyticus]|uniref:hypothetical protein n=1 Tax=Bacteroides cellulosilyticus TaxID=246787 RepID=UPI0018AC96E3|nr:hypothetical protein [Bacteroides cellulosilyticus]